MENRERKRWWNILSNIFRHAAVQTSFNAKTNVPVARETERVDDGERWKEKEKERERREEKIEKVEDREDPRRRRRSCSFFWVFVFPRCSAESSLATHLSSS